MGPVKHRPTTGTGPESPWSTRGSGVDPHTREAARPSTSRRLTGAAGDRETHPAHDRLGGAGGRWVAVLADDEPAARSDDVVELVLQELALAFARNDVEQYVD